MFIHIYNIIRLAQEAAEAERLRLEEEKVAEENRLELEQADARVIAAKMRLEEQYCAAKIRLERKKDQEHCCGLNFFDTTY